MKTYFVSISLLLILFGCQGIDNDNPEELKRQRQIEVAEIKKEKARADSLEINTTRAKSELKNNEFEAGMRFIDSALVYAEDNERNPLVSLKAQAFFELKKYDNAINSYFLLIDKEFDLKASYYKRALCYLAQRKTQEAVDDLVSAMALGNTEADNLHEKINPLKKRVAYYITRCCDGTTSSATGRGACSHHDGVCDWNEPVYEEYRKY